MTNMTPSHKRTAALAGHTLVLTLVFSLLAAPTAYAAGDPIEDFRVRLTKQQGLEDKVRDSTLKLLEAYAKDPDARVEAITAALRQVSPAFHDAMEALADEETEIAVKGFTALMNAKDPYLAAHATFFLGRTLVQDDRFEKALPHFAAVSSGKHRDHTLYRAEATFFHGVCLSKALKRKEALAKLGEFLRMGSANVSERMLVGAQHLIAELTAVEDGSIVDVHHRMNFSERRLTKEDSGKRTQKEQDNIIAMLDKLIEEAEKKEQSGGGGGAGGGQGQQPGQGGQGGQNPSGPADKSSLPEGSSDFGKLHRVNRGSAKDSWGSLPPKEREKILAGLKARFPDRYKKLIEQYYKSFQEGEKKD